MPLNKVNYVDGQTIISAQNMNDIQNEVIRLGEKEIVQSDWLEQDKNSLAYVKNKPFGTAGQYTVLCTAEEAAASDKLIEVISDSAYNDMYNEGSNIYYLYRVSQLHHFFDFYNFGLNHRIAFEDSSGFYATLYDLKTGGGNRRSISTYISNPNITGFIQFSSDIDSALCNGIVVIEESTDDAIQTGVYISLNAKKKTSITRVLRNNSHVFLGPGALSTMDMPLGVLYALMTLEGVNAPLASIIESANESLNNLSNALDNKVDKVGNKVLSDINFTKAYKDEIESIQHLRDRVSNLEQYNPNSIDEADYAAMQQSISMLATEIAANPFGAYLNTQELLGELMKLMSGQTSDKVFMLPDDSGLFLVKMSDKTPTKEDFKKGFSIVMGFPDTFYHFMTLRPGTGFMVPDISFDPNAWEMLGGDLAFEDVDEIGSFAFSDAMMILQEGNPMGLPKGLYTPASSDMLVVGLEINGFNLNASSAPVSQEQLGDISSILDSIIGEQVWTFTLEDGSTVDKVVISSD